MEHNKVRNLNDFFLNLKDRPLECVYFYRINGYSPEIDSFVREYYKVAVKRGVVIEGKIPNPTEQNLSYYNEIMGALFSLDLAFIKESLKKWLPRMNGLQLSSVSSSLYRSLQDMKSGGKNEGMIRNAYIKFMCWLYYRFERIVALLGNEELPKILYEGSISKYELSILSILSNAGCDVVLLQYEGDAPYLKLDPQSLLSEPLDAQGAFPDAFCIKKLRDGIETEREHSALYGKAPSLRVCRNEWQKEKDEAFDSILCPPVTRGSEENVFYNCFFRMDGVENKASFENELFLFYQNIKSTGRALVIVNEKLPAPTTEEIGLIKRGNADSLEGLILSLLPNLPKVGVDSNVLGELIRYAFVETVLNEAKKESNLNRIKNFAVYLLCYIRRYASSLFAGWKLEPGKGVAIFILLGTVTNAAEASFLSLLSMLPVDVLSLHTNLNEACMLEAPGLKKFCYTESLSLKKFPEVSGTVSIGTAAYHAERELDSIMYQDTGLYRNRQYEKANVVALHTMYEEIAILWNQELKYRPGFSVVENCVNIPAICAKVMGIKEANVNAYYASIKALITEDTFYIDKAPFIAPGSPNPLKSGSASFYKNARLMREKIKDSPDYKYGILGESAQNLIFDKMETLIKRKMIRGIGENGMEYTVIATILNLPKDIVHLIQNFDFTKKNPKLIYVLASENIISIEDSIIIAFLSLVGFDILFFVPTGYQTIEKYFNQKFFEEHQIGEYVYDLNVPDMRISPKAKNGNAWFDKIKGLSKKLKRG